MERVKGRRRLIKCARIFCVAWNGSGRQLARRDVKSSSLTFNRSASATLSRVRRPSTRAPPRIAPSLASSSVTAGIHVSSTSVSAIMRMSSGEMVIESRNGWRERSTALGDVTGQHMLETSDPFSVYLASF